MLSAHARVSQQPPKNTLKNLCIDLDNPEIMILTPASTLAFGLAYCATQVYALPQAHDFPPYQKPGHGDARSACPGINALANHGWLPHDGRNITRDMLVEALRGGFGFDLSPSEPAFATSVFASAINDTANIALHPEKDSFDMDAVNTHNGPIEFDGSVSRKDDFFGSPVPFDKPTWDTQWRLMEEEQKSSNSTEDVFDLGVASRARARHVLIKSQAGNEDFLFDDVTLGKSAGTTALYMLVLGGMTKSVRKDWLRAFFAEERIPYEEGFQPQKDVSSANLNALTGEIISLAPGDILCSFNPDTLCP
ncbi:hypothetical protein KVR01_010465 [Diaporthe batatas]|uniref:uncharacterized protein n=1 Tax=Diaporthe batatas TaxID=748121 RepID=UPI001D038B9F|nr:uncharacterized protein KVR01_010465 [Diaporthe batatas]KAG8159828.1 hypothetical protein KVR01_010465 [Diaporthe batatas]